jgi:hypothetical protein
VNFFRMDQPNGRPQSGTGWSAPMVGDFHALDKFGVLAFADESGALPPPKPPVMMPGGRPMPPQAQGKPGAPAPMMSPAPPPQEKAPPAVPPQKVQLLKNRMLSHPSPGAAANP